MAYKRKLQQEEDRNTESEELDWSHIEPVDQVGLEIGYGLIPLIDQDTGGTLLSRVRGIRKKLSSEIGFLVNPIRIRDNLEIGPNDYNIVLNGTIRGQGKGFYWQGAGN